MRLTKIYETADQIAPFALSGELCEKYGYHDNSGIIVDCGGEIASVLFALDLTAGAVARAKQIGAQLVFTHHPAIYHPLSSLRPTGAGAQVLACARAGISVVSAHLNLDCAEGGTDETLMTALGGKKTLKLMDTLSGGGYGRIYEIPETPFEVFAENAKKALNAVRVIGYGNAPVKRVASFCGGGMDERSVSFSLENAADTFISSDPKHHLVLEAIEGGMNVLLFTHYATERVGLINFMEKFKRASGVSCEFYTDERYL